MSTQPHEIKLINFGFSQKEARVYLASLELGPSPIQKIANKSGVKRATTYVMVQSLMDRGLMSSFEKGKKTFFSAESPERLSNILEHEKNSLDSRKGILRDLLPELISLNKEAKEGQPKISYYEGIEGLKAIYTDILETNDKTLENIVSLDDARRIEPSAEDLNFFRFSLKKKGVKIRVLYTAKDSNLHLPNELLKSWEFRKIPSAAFPLHGELTLYGNKVAALSYRGKLFGTIIESREISQTVRVLFELAWITAQTKKEV